jgi:hypothetical protein
MLTPEIDAFKNFISPNGNAGNDVFEVTDGEV